MVAGRGCRYSKIEIFLLPAAPLLSWFMGKTSRFYVVLNRPSNLIIVSVFVDFCDRRTFLRALVTKIKISKKPHTVV